MNHYTISESDRQELIAALESTGRHNCLAYGVKSLQPVAQAAQPAQSTAAIKTLEHLGYTYYGAEYWKPPLGKRPRFLDDEAHAHAIDTSPERVEKQAGDVQVPEGWQLVPVKPTQAMWSELARDIVFWMYSTRSPHYGSKLHEFLRNCGTTIPDWLTKEIPDVDHTPPKGTVAVCIYKAMLSAAPSTKESQP